VSYKSCFCTSEEAMTAHVNFVIAGTQKGGTSALDAYLRAHTQVGMARVKETHFFDNEDYFRATAVDYRIYHEFFAADGRLGGEATPIYMYWQDAPGRIWQYNPMMKWIILLRNPISRAYSHWNMERARGADTLSFAEAIAVEETRCREALPYQHRVYSYLDRGFYSEQLRRIWRFFPRAQVLVLKSEDLRDHPQATLDQVCAFLDIAPLALDAPQCVHALPYPHALGNAEKNYLTDWYEYEIKQLEKMLDWDCRDWLVR
jgi:hypothetical protein